MIVHTNFLKKLKDFGLNSYEAKLWTALLSRGISTAGELSDIANVPRSRCYDVLESLEKKGFIITKLGKPIKYIAIEPAEVVERVKKKVDEDAKNQISLLDSLEESDVLTELNALHNQGIELVEPADLTGSLKGRTNIYNHLSHLIKGAKKEVVIMTTGKGAVRKSETLKKALTKAKKNNVNVKMFVPSATDSKKATELFKGFAKVKNVDKVKGRIVLVDGEHTTFMLTDDKNVHPSYDAAVWVKSPFFASTVKQMFDKL